MTQYVVLKAITQEVEDKLVGGRWEEVGTFESRSAKGAVSTYVKENNLKGGTFTAVPARSFKPIEPEMEMVPRLRFK